MRAPAKPDNDMERLSSLYSYNILDSLPEENVDAITRIASEICGTKMSLVTLIDSHRQWFKSVVGFGEPGGETERDLSFCAHAILSPQEIFEVPDAGKDERFYDNPYVTGDPHVAFYAGVPLVNKEGYPLGTLCVLDNVPKNLTENQKLSLQALAKQVVSLFELNKANEELHANKELLEQTNEELERFAHVVAHDLKSPANNIISLTDMMISEHSENLDPEAYKILGYLKSSSKSMKELIDSILKHAKAIHLLSEDKSRMSFSGVMEQVKAFVPVPDKFKFEYEGSDSVIYVPASALVQILLNLCNNAVKYNDKNEGFVKVSFKEEDMYYVFSVSDNGMGIPEKSHKDIFGIFQTLGEKDGSQGIGLSTVKKLVERLGGTISVSSVVGEWSTFTFTIKK